MAMALLSGAISRSSPSRFESTTPENIVTPVTLPPGRLRLSTRPSLTGSAPASNTIGIVAVAAFAAWAGTRLVWRRSR